MKYFFHSKDFHIEDFYNVFSVTYRLLYNDVVVEDYGYVKSFDYMIGKFGDPEIKEFYKDFCNFRRDICTSDRECVAFMMAYKCFEEDYKF